MNILQGYDSESIFLNEIQSKSGLEYGYYGNLVDI